MVRSTQLSQSATVEGQSAALSCINKMNVCARTSEVEPGSPGEQPQERLHRQDADDGKRQDKQNDHFGVRCGLVRACTHDNVESARLLHDRENTGQERDAQ